jgi:hypothetical protein
MSSGSIAFASNAPLPLLNELAYQPLLVPLPTYRELGSPLCKFGKSALWSRTNGRWINLGATSANGIRACAETAAENNPRRHQCSNSFMQRSIA